MSLGAAPMLPRWLRSELPFDRVVYRLERGPDAGRTLRLICHGSPQGRPVVLFHGNPTWSFLWRKVIAELDPDRYRLIAPDLLGFGLSSAPRRIRDHSLERHVVSLVELLEGLDIEAAIVVGQDWGGPMAAAVAARLSGRVAAVVLANTSVLLPRRWRGTRFHRLARVPLVSDALFRGLNFPQCALWFAQGDRRSIGWRETRAYLWPFLNPLRRAGPLALARMVPDGPTHPSVPLLREGAGWLDRFGGPMALVWGEADPILGRALDRHREAFPRATVRRTEAGHFLQEEVPGQIVAAIEEVGARLAG